MQIFRTTFASWVPIAAVMLCSVPGCADSGAGETAPTASAGLTATDGETSSMCLPTGLWQAPDWDTNAADVLMLRAQLQLLTGDATMRGAELGQLSVDDVSNLMAVWEGSPSLAAAANSGYTPVVQAAFGEFVTLLAAAPQDLMDAQGNWAPGADGGVWGEDSRGINEGGLSVRQFVDKGSFSGGLFYAYAADLAQGEVTVATLDAIAAAWGANSTLDPLGDLTHSANYALAMGFYAEMASALTDAKNYAGNEQCAAERDEAIVRFFSRWEQSMFARMVFYASRAQSKLQAAATMTQFADVLNDLAEGLALVAGFSGLPQATSGPLVGRRSVNDEAVAAVMLAFGVDLADLGASSTGRLVESLPELESSAAAAEAVVMDLYALDAATIQTYKTPTPG